MSTIFSGFGTSQSKGDTSGDEDSTTMVGLISTDPVSGHGSSSSVIGGGRQPYFSRFKRRKENDDRMDLEAGMPDLVVSSAGGGGGGGSSIRSSGIAGVTEAQGSPSVRSGSFDSGTHSRSERMGGLTTTSSSSGVVSPVYSSSSTTTTPAASTTSATTLSSSSRPSSRRQARGRSYHAALDRVSPVLSSAVSEPIQRSSERSGHSIRIQDYRAEDGSSSTMPITISVPDSTITSSSPMMSASLAATGASSSGSSSSSSSSSSSISSSSTASGKGSGKKKSGGSVYSKVKGYFSRKGKPEEDKIDEVIRKRLKQESKLKPLSVWLLGAGGSGKTTVRKQMQYFSVMSRMKMEGTFEMHRDSYSLTPSGSTTASGSGGSGGALSSRRHPLSTHVPMDRALLTEMSGLDVPSVIDNIQHNIISDMVELCSQNFAIRTGRSSYYQSRVDAGDIDKTRLNLLNDTNERYLQEFLSQESVPQQLTPSLAQIIEALWEDPGIQATFELRRQSHIMDSTDYFMDRVRTIAKVDYVPSWDDWVHIRDTTSGFVTKEIIHYDRRSTTGTTIHITDCGGQRNERKKWFKILERSGVDIDVCVWVMSLSAYDQILFEDHSQNCLTEAFQLFNAIVHHPVFRSVDFFVFLNKTDLFEEKLERVPFTVYKSDFPRDKAHSSAAVIQFIKQEFQRIFESPHYYAEFLTVQTRFFHTTDTPSPTTSSGGHSRSKSKSKSRSRSRRELSFDDGSGDEMDTSASGSSPSGTRKRNLIFKETCATDTQKISKVIQFVNVNSIKDRLKRLGLVA